MYVGEDSWASGGIVDVPMFEVAWADESFPVVGPYSMAKRSFSYLRVASTFACFRAT
jgi:hypothetical protein